MTAGKDRYDRWAVFTMPIGKFWGATVCREIFLSDLCRMSGAPLCVVAFDARDFPTVPGVTNETVHSQTSIL